MCINLIAEYITQSYFAHFLSLFSLSLLILNMVSEPPLGCWADLPPIVCPHVDDHATCEGAY